MENRTIKASRPVVKIFKILVIALGVVLVFFIGKFLFNAYQAVTFLQQECESEIIFELPSPSGEHVLTHRIQRCEKQKYLNILEINGETAGISEDDLSGKIDFHWNSNEELQINASPQIPYLKVKTEVGTIKVNLVILE